jgi:GMP synthase (glutamine-hydrolysing)
MTGRPAVPGKDFPSSALDEMVAGILRDLKGVSRVAYDLTSKPPGTTEWE